MTAIWRDRKRILGMPISFTRYTLTDRLVVQDAGLMTTVHDEVQLFRVNDVKVVRSLCNKMVGCGTVILYSSDKSHPQFHIHNIKDALRVKDLIMERVDEERRRNRVLNNDLLNGGELAEDCEDIGCDLE